VTDHRKHHALSDKPGGPALAARGPMARERGAPLRGFVHAHVGWMFSNLGMEQGREYGRDLYEDRLVRTIDRLYLLWVVVTLGIPFWHRVCGWRKRGRQGSRGSCGGGLIRIAAYQHATFSVNSICHMFGPAGLPDAGRGPKQTGSSPCSCSARGWHNNHHAFPASRAGTGCNGRQIDVSVVGDPRPREAAARLERQGAGRGRSLDRRRGRLASGLKKRRSSSPTRPWPTFRPRGSGNRPSPSAHATRLRAGRPLTSVYSPSMPSASAPLEAAARTRRPRHRECPAVPGRACRGSTRRRRPPHRVQFKAIGDPRGEDRARFPPRARRPRGSRLAPPIEKPSRSVRGRV